MQEVKRAQLIPMKGDQADVDKAIPVQFNPASLKVAMSNSLKADAKAKGEKSTSAQHVEKSSSTLTFDLVFDTTIPDGGAESNAPTDVRLKLRPIAEAFMKPGDKTKDGIPAPGRCQFRWGSFAFTGMVSSWGETLDFFAPEGIPLRATLSLTLTEDKYQFEVDEGVKAAQRDTPSFQPAASGAPVAKSLQDAGLKPGDWRAVALFNGLESPRFGAELGLSLPSVELSASAGFGASASVGISASASASASASVGVSFGASASLGTSIGGAFSLGN
jgi:hypothetical protein